MVSYPLDEVIKYPLDEGLTPLERWLKLKELESVIKIQLDALKELVEEEVANGNGEGMVTKVTKTTIKPKDSIIKFLEDKDLLRLVKKDDIDMAKINQLVEAGVVAEEELEEHLERKESSYLKKSKK